MSNCWPKGWACSRWGLELFIRCGPEIIDFIHSQTAARVFLDLKLHDIPATVGRAMTRIADLGVAFATVHVGETRRMLETAVEGSGGKVGILGVTVLTSVSAKDLESAGYRQDLYDDMPLMVLQRAQLAHEAGCAGVICSGLEAGQIKERFGNDFLAVTPGNSSGRGGYRKRGSTTDYNTRPGHNRRSGLSGDWKTHPGCGGSPAGGRSNCRRD